MCMMGFRLRYYRFYSGLEAEVKKWETGCFSWKLLNKQIAYMDLKTKESSSLTLLHLPLFEFQTTYFYYYVSGENCSWTFYVFKFFI